MKDLLMAQHWWCSPSRGHAEGPMCKRAAITEAIATSTEAAEKTRLVEKLKQSIQAGQIDAQGLDATNPERHRMMEAWCDSTDEANNVAKKGPCIRAANHRSFVKRRETLLTFWCEEQGQAGSPKCAQMEFGQKIQNTDSGAERKRLAADFKAKQPSNVEDQVKEETKQMMHAVCASSHGKTELFKSTCSRIHHEL
eukprot:CAMPEP_0119300364 /NCGR_PEP_ID=MMETSP1333-20130426/2312_1 /TAXON_ID=418940 /ORGANISM="Scyphosphaera apsteinii, Strain RCC1455" /LENGTH=195 /DNA_ID=CAMNT_0007302103 /DNA_START=144 /DNA_END=731 /DNA_ORIENTATION=-